MFKLIDQINDTVSSKPNIIFIFCTACPEAPFIRLSITENITILPDLSINLVWIMQLLVFDTHLV